MRITEEYILKALRNTSTRIEHDGPHDYALREGIPQANRRVHRVVDICAVPATMVE